MKYRHIATGLIILSLIAFTFIATVAAEEYTCYMFGIKHGKDFTLTIDTSVAETVGGDTIFNFGLYVDTDSIIITIFDMKGVATTIDPDWTRIAVNPDGSCIVIYLVKQDGLPSQALSLNAVGSLLDPYAGDKFFASGPGWAYRYH